MAPEPPTERLIALDASESEPKNDVVHHPITPSPRTPKGCLGEGDRGRLRVEWSDLAVHKKTTRRRKRRWMRKEGRRNLPVDEEGRNKGVHRPNAFFYEHETPSSVFLSVRRYREFWGLSIASNVFACVCGWVGS